MSDTERGAENPQSEIQNHFPRLPVPEEPNGHMPHGILAGAFEDLSAVGALSIERMAAGQSYEEIKLEEYLDGLPELRDPVHLFKEKFRHNLNAFIESMNGVSGADEVVRALKDIGKNLDGILLTFLRILNPSRNRNMVERIKKLEAPNILFTNIQNIFLHPRQMIRAEAFVARSLDDELGIYLKQSTGLSARSLRVFLLHEFFHTFSHIRDSNETNTFTASHIPEGSLNLFREGLTQLFVQRTAEVVYKEKAPLNLGKIHLYEAYTGIVELVLEIDSQAATDWLVGAIGGEIFEDRIVQSLIRQGHPEDEARALCDELFQAILDIHSLYNQHFLPTRQEYMKDTKLFSEKVAILVEKIKRKLHINQ